MLHYQAVSPGLLTVLRKLMDMPLLAGFRLAGGTSLALQIGHRTSVDIDLFTDTGFDKKNLQSSLLHEFPSFQLLWQNENGFSANVNNVKIDVFNGRVRFINEPVKDEGLRLFDKKEVGAMKLEAITDRKTKKDFCGLYFLLHLYSLAELVESFRMKYPFIDYKFVIESLWLIDRADDSEPPVMSKDFSWTDGKEYILSCVKKYWSDLQDRAAAKQQNRLKKAEELLRKKKKD